MTTSIEADPTQLAETAAALHYEDKTARTLRLINSRLDLACYRGAKAIAADNFREEIYQEELNQGTN
jgi:hypothetical protein